MLLAEEDGAMMPSQLAHGVPPLLVVPETGPNSPPPVEEEEPLVPGVPVVMPELLPVELPPVVPEDGALALPP